MSLNYIFGGSGYGKTVFCLNSIKNILKNNKETKIIYIVPEQFTHQSEKNLIDVLDEGCIISAEVLSFKRLAYYIFSKEGGVPTNIIDSISKNMIIKKIVLENRQELKYYKKSINKLGFIDSLSSTITDFFNCRVKLKNLEDLLFSLDESSIIYNKMHDLILIYKKYIELTKNFISDDKILNFLPEKIFDSDYLKDVEIWIDSFVSFSHQEYKVLEAIISTAKEVHITITIKEKEVSYPNLKITDNFFESKNTINIISQISINKNIKINKPAFLKNPIRFKNYELKHLEKNYFNYYINPYQEEVNNIFIIESVNICNEIDLVAKKIINLIRDQNYNYNDIGILTGNIETYKKFVEYTFNRYNINYFIDCKEDVLSHPLINFITSMLEIVSTNWAYEPIFRFLKCGMTNLSIEVIDTLENYVLANGIKGYKWHLEEWNYGFENSNYDKEKINFYKNEVLKYLEPVNINYKKTISVKKLVTNIFTVIDNLNIDKVLEKWTDELVKQSEHDIVNIHHQTWNSIVNLFDDIVEILGDDKTNIKDFSKILESGFKTIELSTIPMVQDKIIIGDFERSRFPRIKVLFVLGVNEGLIPKIKDDLGFLNDEDKEIMNINNINTSNNSYMDNYKEQFMVYSAITKPEDYLFLSYNVSDINGKIIKQSSLIYRIKELFPKIKLISYYKEDLYFPEIALCELGISLRHYVQTNEISYLNKHLYNWFQQNNIYKDKIFIIKKIILGGFEEKPLTQNIVNYMYKNKLKTSISRLEKYSRCPYSYFLDYNLKIKERKLFSLENIDYGNIFHKILEEFMKNIESNTENINKLNQNNITDIVNSCVNKVCGLPSNTILQSSESYRYKIKKINDISNVSISVLIEQLKQGAFIPYGSEVAFGGESELKSLMIDIDNLKKIILTGQIDRVDILSTETGDKYIKIIDYKLGNTKFDIDELYFGLQLQLILYMDTLIKNAEIIFNETNLDNKVFPAGMFYFTFDSPIISTHSNLVQHELNDLILKSFKMSGLVQSEKNILNKLESNIESKSKFIPVEINKNGSLSVKSSVANIDEFNNIRKDAIEKIKEIGTSIFDGKIEPYPYKKSNKTGCDYCKYSAICSFETKKEAIYNVVHKNKHK